MVAVLLLALLASAAALSFSQPIRAARSQDAIDQLRTFDATVRQAAVAAGRATRMVLDLRTGTIARSDGGTERYRTTLPPGYRVDQVRIGDRTVDTGQALIDVSPLGISRTYALRLHGPTVDQWLLFAGLSGQLTLVIDESNLDAIFAQIAQPGEARHDAD